MLSPSHLAQAMCFRVLSTIAISVVTRSRCHRPQRPSGLSLLALLHSRKGWGPFLRSHTFGTSLPTLTLLYCLWLVVLGDAGVYKGGRLSEGEGRGEIVIHVGCDTFQNLASLGSSMLCR